MSVLSEKEVCGIPVGCNMTTMRKACLELQDIARNSIATGAAVASLLLVLIVVLLIAVCYMKFKMKK